MNNNFPDDASILNGFTPEGLSHSPKVYIETYGCQMNVNDSEVVASILIDNNYSITDLIHKADIILINTCSIRDNAEVRVLGRLDFFANLKKGKPSLCIGVLGCMAERLKEQLIDNKQCVDIVVGPDSYRNLPHLIEAATKGKKGVSTQLSKDETYADINPMRLDRSSISAYVSIMRGCNNMCSYCVVPFTRGIERSRDPQSIVNEIRILANTGYREVTLLGQNVNSYYWEAELGNFRTAVNFADLLEMVALIDPNMRVRFATSHPKDITPEIIYTMAMYENICNHIHLPVQSGSDRMLELMNRHYTRSDYLSHIKTIKEILPDCTISTDIIAGFCSETENDHELTMSLMREVKFDFAYMFKYSERPNTKAALRYTDDVPDDIKTRRLNEIINLQRELSEDSKRKDIGKCFEVLIEGTSKKSTDQFFGRTSSNKVVVFPKQRHKVGDYVFVNISACTPATLIGEIIGE